MVTITTDNEETDIRPAISAITKIFRKHHLNYDQIQMFLGHERIENTRIYAKNSTEQIRKEFKLAMKNYG